MANIRDLLVMTLIVTVIGFLFTIRFGIGYFIEFMTQVYIWLLAAMIFVWVMGKIGGKDGCF